MLFSVRKEILLKIFRLVNVVVVDKRTGNNVTGSHVLLSVSGDHIKLTATDLDLELILESSAELVEDCGEVVVPFRKINDICRAITEDLLLKISLVSSPGLKLNITTMSGFFSVNCLPPSVFPLFDQSQFDYFFHTDPNFLKDLLSHVAFAMGDDEGRQFLNGVFLQLSREEARSVAADGHRLMLWEPRLGVGNLGCNDQIKILIPRKSVFDLLKMLNDVPADLKINISIGKNHFRIQIDNITYTSKLLIATFPAFQKLIPTNSSKILTIQKDVLKGCLLRAVALLGDRSVGVQFIFSAVGLSVIGHNEQEDRIEESLPAEYTGEGRVVICFNIKYVLDFLLNTDTELVTFNIENENSGVLIQDSNLNSYYILMPMQI